MNTSNRVTLPQGILQGCAGKNLDGNSFYQFFGIPYAKPPLEDLRFKAPLPPENWLGIRDATKECTKCFSIDEFTGKPVGSEDCLFLNIFTKSLETNTLKPVMVWFHGGAFIRGTSSPRMYGAEFLMTQDIVLVTFQYRIGMLGFLRFQDPSFEVYGNAGLKDQVMALKYVKENIKYFGGDPDNVTIFGNSAGGTSVSYHVLSPSSRGLFHKAIVQSGSAIKGWDECAHDPIEIGKTVDKNITTEKEAMEIFKNLPVEKLYEVQAKYIMGREIGTVNKQFGPVVEHPDSLNPFLLKNPIDIITSGEYNQVPIITGYNSKEGLLFDYYRILNPKRIMTVDSAIPYFFNLKEGSKERANLEKEIREFYFVDDYDNNLRDLLSDVAYITPCYAIAVNHAKTSKYPVYLYRCTLDTPINYLTHKINLSHVPGAAHFDEVSYIFHNIITAEKLKPGSLEELCIRRMVKLWTNFATFGNPTPNNEFGVSWKSFTNDEHNFLNIDEKLYAGVRPDEKRMNFWAEVYRKYSATNKFM